MSLIDILLQRRQRFYATPTAARHLFVPQLEHLEERTCLSVAAPTGLQLSALSPTQVKLNWTNPAGSFGTRVFFWNGTTTTLLAQLSKGVTTYTAVNLTPNQTQWFAVEAFDNATQARGPWAAIMTPPNAISVPTNFKVVATTQTQISLAWSPVSGALGYRVYGWNGTSAVLLGTTTPSVPAFKVSNLTPGTVYYFYVQAFNANNSASTGWLTTTTTAAGITAPTNLQANPLDPNTIALSWNDSPNATGFKVYQWDGNSAHAAVLLTTLAAHTTGYQAIGLVPGVRYWYYVQAFNATNSANSAWVNAMTPAAAPLQPPTHLVAQPDGSTSVLLSWTEPARAVTYRIFVWTGLTWTVAGTVPAGTHQFEVTGLTPGRTDWFMVESSTTNFAEVAYSSAVFVIL